MNEVDKAFEDAEKIIKNNKRYVIRPENLYELKEGKTDVYIANLVGYTRQYLNIIFHSKATVDRKIIKKILLPIFSESVKLKEKYEKYGFDTMLEHFFKEI